MAVTGQTWTFYAGDRAQIPIVQISDVNGGDLDMTGRIFTFRLSRFDNLGAPLYERPLYVWASNDAQPIVFIPNPTGGSDEDNPQVLLDMTTVLTETTAYSADSSFYLEGTVTEGDGSSSVTVLTGTVTFNPSTSESI